MVRFGLTVAFALVALSVAAPVCAVGTITPADGIAVPAANSFARDGSTWMGVDAGLATGPAAGAPGGSGRWYGPDLDQLTPNAASATSLASGIFSSGPASPDGAPYSMFTAGIPCPDCGVAVNRANPDSPEFRVTDFKGISFTNNAAVDFLRNIFSTEVASPPGDLDNTVSEDDIPVLAPEPKPEPASDPESYVMVLLVLALLALFFTRRGTPDAAA